jgi:hypothetical protein
MDRPLDVVELLRTLERHRVDFVVIGGIAVQVHGHRRTTKDLDVIPAPGRDNYVRLASALAELDAHPREMPEAATPAADQLKAAPIVPPLMTIHGELHILRDVPGAAPYAELSERALRLDVDGVRLAIAAREDVIAMKQASGRPGDIDDLAVLTEPGA